jgi:Ca2+-binding EF-hand superfamily protein
MIIKGDLNGDGRIDYQDLLILQLINLEAVQPSEYEKKAGDVNGDGKISIVDMAKVNRHILGETTINEVIK